MFELSVKSHFSAAHRLMEYDGSCAALHGHNWDVEVFIRGEKLDASGLLVDFKEVKAAVKRVLAEVDHVDLNATDAFGELSPSSENIAKFLYERLSKEINDKRCAVHRVAVFETPTSRAVYWATE
ncbi:MAG: 6-carboxytetrahydropterin synthase QueD [Kiritimatiellae bacterium]|nr:6-carboxytetrahydropterin synthase QueD [Kiritimatiellia bacterium]